jgi:PadR family transcriptional regulator
MTVDASHSPGRRAPLLAGTLDLMILRTLTIRPLHGYAIAQHIERTSEGVLSVDQGSLYPALERLLKRGWATAGWDRSPTGRHARYYTITRSGRRQLEAKRSEYERLAGAVARVLGRA